MSDTPEVIPIHWTEDPRAGTDDSPVPLTPNQLWTIDPISGKRVVDFDFIEEPLGMSFTLAPGLGWPQFEFGEFVGPDGGQYKILRKLGWGMNSSTWLVQDQRSQNYIALKDEWFTGGD